MIVQADFLKKIKDFGLNTYEAKLWTALLSRGVSTAGELSDIANVPRSRSYDVLESLEKKGFIVMKIGKPIKYMAVPPEEVIDRVQKRIREESVQQEKIMDELKDSTILKELILLHNTGIETVNPNEMAGSIKGRNNIYNHFETMIKGAKKSIILITSADGLTRKHAVLAKSMKKAAEKGVKIKIFAPANDKNKAAIDDLKKHAEFIHGSSVKGRLLLVDDSQLSFMLMDDEKTHPDYELAVWVNTPVFVNTIKGLLNKC